VPRVNYTEEHASHSALSALAVEWDANNRDFKKSSPLPGHEEGDEEESEWQDDDNERKSRREREDEKPKLKKKRSKTKSRDSDRRRRKDDEQTTPVEGKRQRIQEFAKLPFDNSEELVEELKQEDAANNETPEDNKVTTPHKDTPMPVAEESAVTTASEEERLVKSISPLNAASQIAKQSENMTTLEQVQEDMQEETQSETQSATQSETKEVAQAKTQEE
jgi:hypothetical protein